MTTNAQGPGRPKDAMLTVEERTEIDAAEDYSVDASNDPDEDDFGWPDDGVDPLPVYLTEVPPQDQSLVKWSSSRYTVRDTPAQIAGNNLNRKSVLLVNHSTANDLFVSHEQDTPVAFSGKIEPGASLELTSNTRVYARCNSGLTAEVSVFQEYVVNEDG